jgi:hypothetical protein
MSKLRNIYTGWKNYLTDNELANELAQERAPFCSECTHAVFKQHLLAMTDEVKIIEGFVCELCHCPLSAKLRVPEEKCPDVPAKW